VAPFGQTISADASIYLLIRNPVLDFVHEDATTHAVSTYVCPRKK